MHSMRVCVTNRQLHKGEVRRQREKALGSSVDSDSGSDMEIDNGFSVPGRIWNKLYRWVASNVILFISVTCH